MRYQPYDSHNPQPSTSGYQTNNTTFASVSTAPAAQPNNNTSFESLSMVPAAQPTESSCLREQNSNIHHGNHHLNTDAQSLAEEDVDSTTEDLDEVPASIFENMKDLHDYRNNGNKTYKRSKYNKIIYDLKISYSIILIVLLFYCSNKKSTILRNVRQSTQFAREYDIVSLRQT